MDTVAKGHILLVDDHVHLLMALRDYLEYQGFTVSIARNGREALAAAARQTPDVVFLDLNMPVMSGPAFLEEIRDGEGATPYPVVILSALSDIEAYRHQPGVWDYLPKPCSENEILSTAQHAIDSVRRKPAGGNRRHHLLAAEDQSAAAEALQHHAASEGFDLDVVSAGAELLERAAHVRPDAMLLKDALPGVSGTVLFNIISRIPALNKTPIVLYASRQEMIADMPATPSPDGVCHRMASSDPREVIEVVAGLLRTPSDL